ncbi:MAG: hypothetical protein EX271_09145 [Acidimicrobiales bacterium]|nr:hypothetical protein [Hyphomonadaceae bacterium]RZV40918.1 MAG: hypothetical protein EX271_09145 [Acidimicrobiales bacterium]
MFFNKKPFEAPKFDQEFFDEEWKLYIDCAEKSHPPFKSYLAQGAKLEDITSAETAIACEFSEDLKHLLSLHDGSNEYQVLPGWELYSCARIVDEWSVWENLYQTQFKPEKYRCNPNGTIKGDEWWRLKWIPFCGDGGGNHLCLDMDPPAGGTIGQIITMWHDADNRDVAAKSLTGYISMIAGDIDDGDLVWNEEWGGIHLPIEKG